MLQQPNIWALRASSSLNVRPDNFILSSCDWLTLLDFSTVSAKFSLDLSIKAAISVGSKISFFSNSDTCFTLLSSTFGFCLSSFFTIFFTSLSGMGIASGLIFLTFFGGACSDTSFFSFSFISSIIFFALGANGIFVLSVIWINSTDIIGGKSIGFFATNGKLITAATTINKCNADEISILFCTIYLSL